VIIRRSSQGENIRIYRNTTPGATRPVIELGLGTDTNDELVGVLGWINRNNSDASGGTNRNIVQMRGFVHTANSNTNDDSGGYLTFHTKSNTGGLTQVLKLDSAQNATFTGAVTIAAGGGNMIIQGAQNMYFDGGSHTRITESSNDVLDFYAGTTNALRLTTTAVGVGGATMQTWDTGIKALHIGATSALADNAGYFSGYENAFLNASDDYVYITDGPASMFYTGNGVWNFRVSNHTGTAGQTIGGNDTWLDALYISNSGNATFAGGITFSQGGSASDNSIYHHTNNWMYVMGGTSGLALKGENSDDATVYLDNSNQRITLYTNNEERLKIDNSMALFSGYVRATTSSSNYIEILGYDSPQAGYVQTSSGCEIRLAPAGSTKMQINPNGNIGAPTGSNIYNASDKRLKRNIVNLSNSLTKINQMQGVSFNWIDGFCDDEKDTTLYGLIAQDLQSVDSNLVAPFGNDSVVVKEEEFESPLRVNEKFVIPMLVEAVKELSAKVEALENA